jgi:hypothetical protein
MDKTPQETTTDGVKTILEKLDQLASKELIVKLQGQQVADKGEILASIASLRTETRTEIATVRASIDTTNMALSLVDGRVKKLETRSMTPPRIMSPTPRAYDLKKGESMAPEVSSALVEDLKTQREQLDTLAQEFAVMQHERDEAKAAEAKAKEREQFLAEYAAKAKEDATKTEEESRVATAKSIRKNAETRRNIKYYVGIAIAVSGAVGTMINHYAEMHTTVPATHESTPRLAP